MSSRIFLSTPSNLLSRLPCTRQSTLAAAATAAGRRSFLTSQTLFLKESANHDPNPDLAEKHKQDSLAKQQAGKGHWKPELASDSEESVKADRQGPEGQADDAALKRLQERTKGAAEQTTKAGTSTKDQHSS